MTAGLYLVDDHAVVRQGLRALLADAGFRVLGDTGDPVVALDEMQRLAPDIALVDLSLGERSGLELLAEMQRRHIEARAIVLTMSAQPRHLATALRHGVRGYLLKGSPSEELLACIEAVHGGSRYFGAGVTELVDRAMGHDDSGDPFARLSPRERQVVVLVVNGRSSADIGAAMHLSPKTIDSYRSRLMTKLGAADVTALVKMALRHGLIDNDA